MAVPVGARAPDFRATKVVGGRFEPFRMHDEIGAGPVVLDFFPFAFSGGCTKQMCTLRDERSVFSDAGARVLAASIDHRFALREWARALAFPHTFIADANREGVRAWGVEYPEYLGVHGVAKRSSFVVDRAGVVRYAWVSEDAELQPPIGEIKRAVEGLR